MNTEAQNYQEGVYLDYTPATAKVAGQVVQIAGLAAICATAIAATKKGSAQISGIIQVRKKQEAFTAGDLVGWDEDGDPYGDTAGLGAMTAVVANADFLGGIVVYDAASTDKTCFVLLNGFLKAFLDFGSGSTLVIATITVSSAELLALYTTPKQLVAAPGAHKVIELLGTTIMYDYATAAYATMHNFTIKYKDGSGVAASGTLSGTGFIDQTVDMVAKLLPVAVAAQAVATIENLALVLTYDTANPITGGGALRVKIAYLVHPTGF